MLTWRRAVPWCLALAVLPYLLPSHLDDFFMAFGAVPVYVAAVTAFCRIKRGRPALLCLMIGYGAGKVVTFERFLNGGAASARMAAAGGAIAIVLFSLACLAQLRARRQHDYRDGVFDAFAGLAGMAVIHWQWVAVGSDVDNHTLAGSLPAFLAAFIVMTGAGLNWGLARDPSQNRRVLLAQVVGAACLLAANAGTGTMMRPDPPAWSIAASFIAMYIFTATLAHPDSRRLYEPEPPRRRRLQMRWMGPTFALLTTPMLLGLFVVRGAAPTLEASLACAVLTGVALWRGSRLLKEREQARREALAEQRFRGLVEHAADVIVVLGHDHRVSYVSDGVRALLGRAPEDLTGAPISTLLDESSAALLHQAMAQLPDGGSTSLAGDVLVRHRNEAQRWISVNVTDQRAIPSIGGWVLNLHDITDRREAEAALTRLALYDPLTGLPNRASVREKLEAAVRQAPGKTAVLFCDLDGFKPVNDRLGHEAGDEVLRAVAGRWSAVLRADDIIGRWGGDEFVVICHGTDADVAQKVAARLTDSLQAPLPLSGHSAGTGACLGGGMKAGMEAGIGVSIGMALHEPGESASSLLARADAAMYATKAARTGPAARRSEAAHVRP